MRGAREVRLVVAVGALGLLDLLERHRPALEREVAGRLLMRLELSEHGRVDVAAATALEPDHD